MMLLTVCCGGATFAQVGFDELPEDAAITHDALRPMVRRAWAALHDSDQPQQAGQADGPAAIVMLSASDGHRPARYVHASGQTLTAAVDAATKKLREDKPPRWLRLDVVTSTGRATQLRDTFLDNYRSDRQSLVLGEGDDRIVLPLARLQGGGLVHGAHLSAQLMEFVVPGFDKLWRRRPIRMQTFRTIGVFYDGERVVPLTDAFGDVSDPSPPQLLAYAHAAGDYLMRAVDDAGRFDYNYDPVSDTTDDDYNLIRHAGTVYAMLELYGVTEDAELLAAAERAIDYLLDHSRVETTGEGRTVRFIVEGDRVALGGVGLTLLALAEHMIVTGKQDHRVAAEQLAAWLMDIQDEDGRFTVHVLEWPSRRDTGFKSLYFPGEALLSLLRLYRVTEDAELLNAARLGCHYQIKSVSGQLDRELEHDHWLLYALNELTRHGPDKLARDHAARLCRAIMQAQHGDKVDPLWRGGWYVPPRSTPAATRAEGMAAAHDLLVRAGDHELAADVRDSIRRSIEYQLRTFVGPARAMFFKNPKRARGGFTGSLHQMNIRNDYVQHNLSALLAYRRILLQRD